ncbi:Ankyrin repeat protein 1 [Giardia muris]|uniref:Ankyrin repeat protein 1 n=1 Tax=Giardia muris TaxID=5742 RepID=A0A4Z1STV8_GIAMU|nr:Ankyrin repeat protein 1 [Giardia muris]|eukprot:TNJ29336.1 Ankyrin repeat protein 1 [Giardia muris]
MSAEQWWDAVDAGDPDAVVALLQEFASTRGADGYTALQRAARLNRAELVRVLAPYEHSLTSPDGKVALMFALEARALPCVQALAPYEGDFVGPNGATPLMCAARVGFAKGVELLVDFNPLAADETGKTALIYATEAASEDCVKELLRKGNQMYMSEAPQALEIAERCGYDLLIRLLRSYIDGHARRSQEDEAKAADVPSYDVVQPEEGVERIGDVVAEYADVETFIRRESETLGVSRTSPDPVANLSVAALRRSPMRTPTLSYAQSSVRTSPTRPSPMVDQFESVMRINPVETEIAALKASFRPIGETGRSYITAAGKEIHTPTSRANASLRGSAVNSPARSSRVGTPTTGTTGTGRRRPVGGLGTSYASPARTARSSNITSSIIATRRVAAQARSSRPSNFAEVTGAGTGTPSTKLARNVDHVKVIKLDTNDHTALMEAARVGNTARVRELMRSDSGRQNRDGHTALMYAAIMDQLECAQLLAPFEVGIQTDGGSTALMLAAEMGNARIVEALLAHEACYRDHDGYTALMLAAEEGHIDVVRILMEKEAAMNDNQGETALMRAARNGHTGIATLLAPREAGMQRKDGYTALMCAAYHGHLSCAELLIAQELRMSMQDGWTALMCAAQNGYVAIARCLSAEEGMQTSSGWTALMSAASHGHRKVADLLIAERPLKDKSGNTAADYAEMHDFGDLAAHLRLGR